MALMRILKLQAAIPFTAFDASKMTIMDKDSTMVDYTTSFDTITNNYVFNFKKTDENVYRIQVLPEAFTDFFDEKMIRLILMLKPKKNQILVMHVFLWSMPPILLFFN